MKPPQEQAKQMVDDTFNLIESFYSGYYDVSKDIVKHHIKTTIQPMMIGNPEVQTYWEMVMEEIDNLSY